jgi:hypothetical protein
VVTLKNVERDREIVKKLTKTKEERDIDLKCNTLVVCNEFGIEEYDSHIMRLQKEHQMNKKKAEIAKKEAEKAKKAEEEQK